MSLHPAFFMADFLIAAFLIDIVCLLYSIKHTMPAKKAI